MEQPEVHLLSRVPWQWFVSLSWKDQKSEGITLRTLFAWLRTVSKWASVPFPRLLWVYRCERGEIGLRLHLHVLIGGLPERVAKSLSMIHSVRNGWLSHGGGWSRVTPYVDSLAGVDYVLKGDYEGIGVGTVGGSAYETRKFGRAPEGMASNSVRRLLRARSNVTGTLPPGTFNRSRRSLTALRSLRKAA